VPLNYLAMRFTISVPLLSRTDVQLQVPKTALGTVLLLISTTCLRETQDPVRISLKMARCSSGKIEHSPWHPASRFLTMVLVRLAEKLE